jgi:lipoprotein-anchoring transpeptidase ErfK/SrfK
MVRPRVLLALLAYSGALAPAITTAEVGAARSSSSAGAVVATLSNMTTLSRWAYPVSAARARREPSQLGRVIGRLHFLTADGQAQLYMALRSYTVGATTWILVPIPGRPNGVTGWVPASALGELHATSEYLRVNRETLRATLYRGGRALWRAPIGVGQPRLPTPRGHFYITEKLLAIGGPFYGPYALGTSAYAPTLGDWPGGGIVGIHGTDRPQLIPGRPSHGCIRLRDADIARLWRMVQVGTPVEIV